MGKIGQGILGGVSGTVGNVIGGSWKGIDYIRIKPDHHTDANTEKQVQHRAKFSAVVALAKSIKTKVIKPIWDQLAVKMSGYNLFVKENIGAFDVDGNVSDYSLLTFSKGEVSLPADVVAADDAAVEGGIKVTWTDNSGDEGAAATDELMLVALAGDGIYVAGTGATRADGEAAVVLPFGPGVEVNVYAFFKNVGENTYSADKFDAVAVS